MSNSTRRVQPTVPTAYDAEDHERAAAIRQLIDAFSALLRRSPNTELDRFYNAEGQRIDGEVGLEERLAENIQSLLEAEKDILQKLDACNGKLATDDHAKPLACVIAIAMSDVMKKFLDNKEIVHGALDVIAKIYDTNLLGKIDDIDDIESMPGFREEVLTVLSIATKVHGRSWFEQCESWVKLENMLDNGPDRVNQVFLNKYLDTARGFMEKPNINDIPVHEVVECVVLLISVLFLHQMTTDFEEYYMRQVSGLALWLVNSFQTEVRFYQHVGVLGCRLLYEIAVRKMELGPAKDPTSYEKAEKWFRKNKIPERLMLFKGFSDEGDKYIREIERRVPPAEAGTQRKRAREPSPEAAAAGAAPAARGLGGSA